MTRTPPSPAARKDVRRAALDAAMELADTEGPMHLTLHAVAARAGISKGGLLHHFSTKDALLQAMVEEVVAGFDRSLHHAAERTTESLPTVGVHVKHSFSGSGRRSRGGMALLAVAALQPELLTPLRGYMRRRTLAVAGSADRPALALAAMLVADAIYLFDALGIPPLSGARRAEVREVALRLLDPSPETAEAASTATLPAHLPTSLPTRHATSWSARVDAVE